MKHLTLASIILLGACATSPDKGPSAVASDDTEDTAVSPGMLELPAGTDRSEAVMITALGETAPVGSGEDAADDPAIWRNRRDPAQSRVLGTDKDAGLYVYDMAGRALEFLPIGQLNNVDLRQGGVGVFDVAAASNDSINAITVFLIDRDTGFVGQVGDIPTGKTEPYGICLGATPIGYLPVVTYKDGTVQVFSMPAPTPEEADAYAKGSADMPFNLVREAKLDTQLEGCVVDEFHNRLFIGEEEAGIWSLDLGDEASTPVAVDMISDGNGLAGDVEGLTLWRGEDGKGWLIASAQGADRYVVYDRAAPHTPRGSFAIGELRAEDGSVIIDAVTHTDGLDAHSGDFARRFPRGFLVVQDDENTAPPQNQNFKYVDWRRVEQALDLPERAAE